MRIHSAAVGCLSFLKDFCKETTLHGLNHVVAPKRHWAERVVWAAALLASVIMSCWLISGSWHRYDKNPVIIALEKDYQNWKIPFPAITICFKEKMKNDSTAQAFIEKNWGVSGGEKFEYYWNFTKAASNIGLQTLDVFEEFVNDSTLNQINILEVAVDMMAKVQEGSNRDGHLNARLHETTAFAWIPLNWTITEIGTCSSAMSYLASALSSKQVPSRNHQEGLKDDKYCNKLGVACGGLLNINNVGDPAFQVYIHSPFEIPDVTTRAEPFLSEQLRVGQEFSEESIVASPALRDLRPSRRNCYFRDEQVYKDIPYYSINLCRMQCRRNLIHQLCHCVPPFYSKQSGQTECDIKGLECVAQQLNYVLNETLNGPRKCKCAATCERQSYNPTLTSRTLRNGVLGMTRTYEYNLVEFSSTRYRRDIIFEFSDLLVNFGGIAALFLGCSVLTFIEMIYFVTVRFVRFLGWNALKSGKKLQEVRRAPVDDDDTDGGHLVARLKRLITLRA